MKTHAAASRAKTLRHFSASLPMMLLRAREAVMVRFRVMLRENGLTEQQWRVLRALDAGGRMDVAQIAEATYLLGPSLTRILRDLKVQRLVTTRPDPEDNRRKIVELSSHGLERIALIAPLSEQIYAEIAEGFGDKNLAKLQELLLELQESVRGT